MEELKSSNLFVRSFEFVKRNSCGFADSCFDFVRRRRVFGHRIEICEILEFARDEWRVTSRGKIGYENVDGSFLERERKLNVRIE